jgi:8-oxo-dGTP pyrophosphatase MutT (NUDIX family)
MTRQIPPERRLSALLARYQDPSASQLLAKQRFSDFAVSHSDVYLRAHAPGHFTASSWLVSGDGQRTLLTHHKKLRRWLQLGGHADGDQDLANVALREAEEESGLTNLSIDPEIFDLDAHEIPQRGVPGDAKFEAAHIHWDVRFVVRASVEDFALSDESLALAWVNIAELAADASADASLVRMAVKWLRRGSDTMRNQTQSEIDS